MDLSAKKNPEESSVNIPAPQCSAPLLTFDFAEIFESSEQSWAGGTNQNRWHNLWAYGDAMPVVSSTIDGSVDLNRSLNQLNQSSILGP